MGCFSMALLEGCLEALLAYLVGVVGLLIPYASSRISVSMTEVAIHSMSRCRVPK
jgi:hypothetical protein